VNEYKFFIMSLGTAIQNGLYYTFSHPETKKAIERNFSFADKIFQQRDRLILTMSGEAAFVNSELIRSNPHITEFLFKFFSERSYSGIALLKGLTLKEYEAFIQILSDSRGKELSDVDRALTSYNVDHAKIIFYQPRVGGGGTGSGPGTGTGTGTGTGGSGGTGNHAPGNLHPASFSGAELLSTEGTGHFVGLGGSFGSTAENKKEQKPATPPPEPERLITVDLDEEDIAALLDNRMMEKDLEEKYGLVPFQRLNSYERARRFGTLAALPLDTLSHMDLVALYQDTVDAKKDDVLQHFIWLFEYNIGDTRTEVKHHLLEEALSLCRELPREDFPRYAKIFSVILAYISSHQEECTPHCFTLLSELTFLSLKRAVGLEDLPSLKAWITMVIESKLMDHFSKKEFFHVVTDLIGLLRKLLKSPDRFHVETLILQCDELAITPLLTSLMDERDKDMRRNIINILVKSGDKAVPFLKRMLRDTRWYVVRNGIKIMGEIGSFRDLSAFAPLTEHKDPRVREELSQALKNIRHPQAFNLLLAMIRKESFPETKTAMIPGISSVADQKGMQLLFDSMKDVYKNNTFAPFCEEVLRETVLFTKTHPELSEKLFSFLEWDHPVTIFKDDHVLHLKEFLMDQLSQTDPGLYSDFSQRIRQSGNKNVKKLMK
jgi:hypothetical protein